MKRIAAILILLVCGAPSAHAVIISSAAAHAGAMPMMSLFPRESLSYSLTGAYSGNCILESTRDGKNWSPTGVVGTSSQSVVGVLYNGPEFTVFRWNVISRTAGTFTTELRDNDDLVREEIGGKRIPVIRYFDTSVRVPQHIVYEPTAEIVLANTTTLNNDNLLSSFAILNSTGGPILMTTTPAISTSTFSEGTMFTIQSATNTVIFQDNGTLTGSLLELGAATRSLGVGDILTLIYRAGKWWETGFYNN